MLTKLQIGRMPADEVGTQIGHGMCRPSDLKDQITYNRIECEAYVMALFTVYGTEPPGATLCIELTTAVHDVEVFPHYTVFCVFDSADPTASAYAVAIRRGLKTWKQASMWQPVVWTHNGRLRRLMNHPELWSMRTNPAGKTKRRQLPDQLPPVEPTP